MPTFPAKPWADGDTSGDGSLVYDLPPGVWKAAGSTTVVVTPGADLSDTNPLPLAAAATAGTGAEASRDDHVHGTSGLLLNGSTAVLAIVHGATAATTRPSTPGIVLWIGSVAPTNALARDIVFTEV